MDMTDPDLAALVGSRICHDLISPVGAIHNGLELLSLQGAGMGPELTLISDSVDSASARIRFFRVAFGSVANGQLLAEREIRRTLAQMTAGGRLRIDWQPEGDQRRDEVQLAFLGLLCLESALPSGGKVSLRFDTGWLLSARGARVAVDPGLWARLSQGTPATGDLAPAHVQFALLPRCAADMGRTPRYSSSETAITLEI